MNNFEFQNPTKIIFGKGSIAKLTTLLPKDKNILLTFGAGSVKTNGVYDQVTTALKGHKTTEFWGIEPNPKFETLIKAIDQVRKENIDMILAVGGGSVLDGTKFIAAAAPYQGHSWDIIKDPSLVKTALPIASVMTLPATGSEMNKGAVISRIKTQEKFSFATDFGYPQFSILDPETTYTLPKFQIACGIIDTFVHTVEQYLTLTNENLLMDRWSEGILQTLIEIGQQAITEEKNYDVMANFMLSATMALNGFTAMGVSQDWATHLIGHELTAFYGLTHGVTLAIVYPALLRVMKTEKQDKILQYAERIWNITEGTTEERIEKSIQKTEQFFQSLGIGTKLSDHGATDTHLSEIVNRFITRKSNLGENGIVTADKVSAILQLIK